MHKLLLLTSLSIGCCSAQTVLVPILAAGASPATFGMPQTVSPCSWNSTNTYPGTGCDSSGSTTTPILDASIPAGSWVYGSLEANTSGTLSSIVGCINSGCSSTVSLTNLTNSPCVVSTTDKLWVFAGYTSSALVSIKATASGSPFGTVAAFSVGYVSAPSATTVDGTPTCSTGLSGTTVTTATTTPASNGDLFYGAFFFNGTSNRTLSVGTNVAWVQSTNVSETASPAQYGMLTETFIQTTAAALAASANVNISSGALGFVVAFSP